MNLGKSIRIYLKEGNVTGIKFAELVNQTIQSFSCPRNKLSELNNSFYNQINTQGVYFLLGYDLDTFNSRVYIGEAENVWDRLKSHDLKKDFWNEVIIFTSKDDNLTKSHVKYLESRIIDISNNAERYSIENSNKPTLNSLPLPDKDAMEEFLSHIKILTGVLGHKFLENTISLKSTNENNRGVDDLKTVLEKDDSNEELKLFLNVKGIKAEAIQTNEGIVVLKGSEVSLSQTKNYGYGALREKLVAENVIKKNGNNKLFFAKNYLFTSVSGAAAVIVGYSINGRNSWKNEEGKSINEIEKRKIKSFNKH